MLTDEFEFTNDKEYWYNPWWAIVNFKKLVKDIGVKKAFDKKKELEAYITAIVLLVVNYSKGEPWWLQIPDEDPPDALAGFWGVNKDKKGSLVMQDVEVFRIEPFKKESISKATIRKLQEKAYPKKTVLIGLINREEDIDVKYIANDLKDEVIKVSSIWLLGSISDVGYKDYFVAQIFPNPKMYIVNIEKECERLKKYGLLMRTRFSLKDFIMEKVTIPRKDLPLLIPNGSY